MNLSRLIKAPEVTQYRDKLPEFCQGCIHAPTCAGGCGAAAYWMLGEEDGKRKPDPFLWQHIDDDFAERQSPMDGRREPFRREHRHPNDGRSPTGDG